MTTERTIDLDKAKRTLLIVGGVAGAISLAGFAIDRQQFFRSYLLGYLFWWGIPIGALALTLLSHLIKSNWGLYGRPYFAAAIKTFPLLALLFVPVALGVKSIYTWADADAVAADPLLQAKTAYLNVGFFQARAVGYFVFWILGSLLITRRSDDKVPPGIAGLGIALLIVTLTFAAIDWSMSLDARWYSTIYGALVGVGGVLTAMAMIIVAYARATAIQEAKKSTDGDAGNEHPGHDGPSVLSDLGTLTLAILMVWAYFSVSQFVIIWSGNLPDESVWYINRMNGGWQFVGIAIVLLHFVAPFMMLLPRENRSKPRMITRVAVLILVIHFVELFWHVEPAFHPDGFYLHWLDLTLPVAIGGFWMYLFIGKLPPVQSDHDDS